MAKKYPGVYYDEKTKTFYIKPRIQNIDGTWKRTTIRGFKTAKEAYEYLQTFKQEKKKNPDTIDITLSELKERYLNFIEIKCDPDTFDNKKNLLSYFCDIDESNQVQNNPNIKLSKIDTTYYSNWQRQMVKKKYKKGKEERLYSLQQLNRSHNLICEMFDYAVNEGLCKLNIPRRVGKFGTPKENKLSNQNKVWQVIDFDEYLRLLEASKDNLKFNTYFDLSFSRGPRMGEVRAFKIKDYNSQKKQLMVNHTMSKHNVLKEPKTASSKAPIDLDDSLNNKVQKLIEYWKQFSDYSDEWYLFNGPLPISEGSLKYGRDKYFKLANIDKHLRLHDFRHSCATWLFSIGIPIEVISKILRHANINETLKTYTHLLESNYISSLDKIYNIKNGGQIGIK